MVCLESAVLDPDRYVVFRGATLMRAGPAPNMEEWDALSQAERLEKELLSAVTCDEESVAVSAVRLIADVPLKTDAVLAALKKRADEPASLLSAAATGALLRMGDTSTLYGLKERIETQYADNPRPLGMIAYYLGRLDRNPQLVPALVALRECERGGIRKSAVHVLRHILSRMAVAALVVALDDSNELVRYHGVMGLHVQTGRKRSGTATSLESFRADPSKYTNLWKRWWETEGSQKCPSVQDVLAGFETTKRNFAKQAVPENELQDADTGHRQHVPSGQNAGD